jgi:hypothetical protein
MNVYPSEMVVILRYSLKACVCSAAAASADISRLGRAASVRVCCVVELLAADSGDYPLSERWKASAITNHVVGLEFTKRGEWRAFRVWHRLILADNWYAIVARKFSASQGQGLSRGNLFNQKSRANCKGRGPYTSLSQRSVLSRANGLPVFWKRHSSTRLAQKTVRRC